VYVPAPVPPVTEVAVALPLLELQLAGVLDKVITIGFGCVIVTVVCVGQAAGSVTETVYVPVFKAVAVAPLFPLDQEYVGAVPPVAKAVAEPNTEHVALVNEVIEAANTCTIFVAVSGGLQAPPEAITFTV
jgi:hypothetical protein